MAWLSQRNRQCSHSRRSSLYRSSGADRDRNYWRKYSKAKVLYVVLEFCRRERILAKVVDRDEGPIVIDISGPTMAGTRAVYAQVPLREDISFGVGSVLLALIESSGLPK